jgi:hypothetical protein
MRLSQATIDLAAQIVERGFAQFIGDGLPLELATMQTNSVLLESGKLVKTSRKIPICYNEWKQIKLEKTQERDARDTAIASVASAGVAGSAERIEAMARLYSPLVGSGAGDDDNATPSDTLGWVSAFGIDLDTMADMLTSAYMLHEQRIKGASVKTETPKKSRKKSLPE